LIIVLLVAAGERSGHRHCIGELPTYGGLRSSGRNAADDRILRNLREKIAGAGRKLFGNDRVSGVVGVLIPTQLRDGIAARSGGHGLIAPLALDPDQFFRFGVEILVALGRAGGDRVGQADGERAELVFRVDRRDSNTDVCWRLGQRISRV
jgi:hypothetical protein